jgi:hypothetical protein
MPNRSQIGRISTRIALRRWHCSGSESGRRGIAQLQEVLREDPNNADAARAQFIALEEVAKKNRRPRSIEDEPQPMLDLADISDCRWFENRGRAG